MFRITAFAVALSIATSAQAQCACLFSMTPGTEFPTTAWLYQNLAPNAPLDPNSAAIATSLRNGLIASAQTLYWYADTPIHRTGYDGPALPTVTVIVGTRNPDGTITQNAAQAALQPYFNAVPQATPHTFTVQGGTDHEAVIYLRTNSVHQVWEGWVWQKTGFQTTNSAGQMVDEWQIQWGGYEPNLTTNQGFWPCNPGPCYGAVAAGIPLQAFSITAGDLDRQTVNHVVGLVIPVSINAGSFHFPAQRTDGMAALDSNPMEGDIFRLPANIDLNAYTATAWDGVSVKSVWRLFAEAMRDHGMVIYDQAANAVAIGEGWSPELCATDPFTDFTNYPRVAGATGGLDYSYHFIATDFPWDQVQLLQRP